MIEDGVCVIYAAASDIGQGCATVFCQDVAQATGLPLSKIRNAVCNTENAPDSVQLLVQDRLFLLVKQ